MESVLNQRTDSRLIKYPTKFQHFKGIMQSESVIKQNESIRMK